MLRLAAAAAVAACSAPAQSTTRTEARTADRMLTLVVSLKKQRIDVYDREGLVTSSPISSGTRSHPTPTGIFTVLQKNRTHFSNLYYSAPMPNMQRITWSGVALHAGALPGYPASHGCIRLPYAFSRTLFSMTTVGTRVIVTDDPVEPREFKHEGLPNALPPGNPVVAAPMEQGERNAIKATATGLGTVTAAIGVTPAIAAEAAVRHVAAQAPAVDPNAPRTRAIARGERQGEIAARANAVLQAEDAHVAAAGGVTSANEALLAAKTELKDARLVLLRMEQDRRTAAAQREQFERKLVDFIKRQRQEIGRAEARSARRQSEHLADAGSNRPTEDLLRRADERTAEAQRDLDAAAQAADQEAEFEQSIAAADLDVRDSEAAALAQRETITRLQVAHDQAEAALPAARTAYATARNRLDEAKAAHARAISALAQFDKPATVLVSRKTGKLYIRQGYEDVFQAPVAIKNPEHPIGTHVFSALRYHDASETSLDWRLTTVSDGSGAAPKPTAPKPTGRTRAASMDDEPAISQLANAPTATNALERLELTPELKMRISELLKPGSTIIVSDAGISNETGKYTDIIVQPR